MELTRAGWSTNLAYTTGDLVTKVQRRIRDTGYSSSEIKDYLNDTLNDVYNEYRLPFMQVSQNYVVSPGQPDITNGAGLPTDFVQAINLISTDSGLDKVITYIDFSALERRFPNPSNTNLHPANYPLYWYKYNETINLFPAPNSGFTVELQYYKKPTLLDADDGVPELPSEFEEVLVRGASYRVLQVKDNYDQAAIHENKYDELLLKLVTKYSLPQTGRPTLMRINRNGVGKSHF